MCCINKIFIILTNYLYTLNVKNGYAADYFPRAHIKQCHRAEQYQTSSATPQASCRGTETMISIYLFFFVPLSLTLGDYFTHLDTTWEQDGRAGKQLQFGKGWGPRPSAVRHSDNVWVYSDQIAVMVRKWRGQERKGQKKFEDILT